MPTISLNPCNHPVSAWFPFSFSQKGEMKADGTLMTGPKASPRAGSHIISPAFSTRCYPLCWVIVRINDSKPEQREILRYINKLLYSSALRPGNKYLLIDEHEETHNPCPEREVKMECGHGKGTILLELTRCLVIDMEDFL